MFLFIGDVASVQFVLSGITSVLNNTKAGRLIIEQGLAELLLPPVVAASVE